MTTHWRWIGTILLAVIIAASAACRLSSPSADKETTSIKNPKAGNGLSYTTVNNTLIILLQAGNPIREIIIDEALVIGGGAPIFEIDGNPGDTGNGTIRIGTLTMDTVDARRLEIQDTQAVSQNLTNVVAHDDELFLNIGNVTEVFVMRGTTSNFSFKNLRVDRIRILGVGGYGTDTHIERLTITRSSFIGTIRIEDVKITSLVLNKISLED